MTITADTYGNPIIGIGYRVLYGTEPVEVEDYDSDAGVYVVIGNDGEAHFVGPGELTVPEEEISRCVLGDHLVDPTVVAVHACNDGPVCADCRSEIRACRCGADDYDV